MIAAVLYLCSSLFEAYWWFIANFQYHQNVIYKSSNLFNIIWSRETCMVTLVCCSNVIGRAVESQAFHSFVADLGYVTLLYLTLNCSTEMVTVQLHIQYCGLLHLWLLLLGKQGISVHSEYTLWRLHHCSYLQQSACSQDFGHLIPYSEGKDTVVPSVISWAFWSLIFS
jgi:hypothetical protein